MYRTLSLSSLPQKCQQERCGAAWLVDGPDNLLREGEGFIDELGEVGFVIFDFAGEQLSPRRVQYVSPVGLFAHNDAGPGFVHEYLRPSVANKPSENPADGSLCSEFSPISISGQSLQWDRGAIPFEPSNGGVHKAILGPCGHHPRYALRQH